MNTNLLDKLHFLVADGFLVEESKNRQKMSLSEFCNSIFGYLEDYRQMGFYFIRYPDQIIKLTKDKDRFRCFGVCDFGCFVLNENKKVYLIHNDCVTFKKKFVYVNASLDDFLQSYCHFMISIYSLKGILREGENALEVEAANFLAKIREVDYRASQEDSFWFHIAYFMEDHGITLGVPLVEGLRDGRL